MGAESRRTKAPRRPGGSDDRAERSLNEPFVCRCAVVAAVRCDRYIALKDPKKGGFVLPMPFVIVLFSW